MPCSRKRCLVIGYGAAGIAALNELCLPEYDFKVDCYDAYSAAGGVWQHCSDPEPLEISFATNGLAVALTASERKGLRSQRTTAMFV